MAAAGAPESTLDSSACVESAPGVKSDWDWDGVRVILFGELTGRHGVGRRRAS